MFAMVSAIGIRERAGVVETALEHGAIAPDSPAATSGS